ncbi:MAG TPA: DUF4397 domain-containing protein [Gemmatimonadales bacterium]|nr:DUF4397 domain-containing protein [Gemmatimonadales bacterium]
MRVLRVLLAISLALGCSNDNSGPNPADTTALRFLHASPDSPAFDTYIAGSLAVQALPYRAASSFLLLNPGAPPIQVRTSGTVNLLLETTPDLSAGTVYTLAVVGTAAALEPLLLTEDTTSAASGTIKIRMVHLAPLGPAMDLYVTGASDDIAALAPTIAGVTYKSASTYANPASGTVRLRVTEAGTKNVLVDSGSLNLTSGQVGSLIVFGNSGTGGGGAPYSAQLY